MPQRFPLISTWRWLIPAAIAMGLVGLAAFDGRVPRLVCGASAALVTLLWIDSRRRRPVLIVDDEGYRVEVAGRLRLGVRWDEVRRVLALPAEQAMYLDCGDPARNLLLPPRRGYGFRFLLQDTLYVILAGRLESRLEIVTSLEGPPPVPPEAAAEPSPPSGGNGVAPR